MPLRLSVLSTLLTPPLLRALSRLLRASSTCCAAAADDAWPSLLLLALWAQLPAPPRPTRKAGAACECVAMRSMSSLGNDIGRSLAVCTLPLPPRPVVYRPLALMEEAEILDADDGGSCCCWRRSTKDLAAD